jgi:hypothetical protein
MLNCHFLRPYNVYHGTNALERESPTGHCRILYITLLPILLMRESNAIPSEVRYDLKVKHRRENLMKAAARAPNGETPTIASR